MARKMRDSGVEWIGEVPEGWALRQIGCAYDIVLGKMLASEQSSQGETLENYICAANIKWTGINTDVSKQMWFSEEEKSRYKLLYGDLLVMEGGLAGTSSIYRDEFKPCFIQNSVLRCRAVNPKNDLIKFLYYWLHAVFHRGYIDSVCNRATIQHFTKDKIKHTPFPVVSMKEQRRITDYLDEKCAAIDGAVDELKRGIEDYKAWKKAIIFEAVTGKANVLAASACAKATADKKSAKVAKRQMRDSGIPWIGEIPEGWEVSRVKNECINFDSLREPISAENRENKQGLYDYYGASGVIDKIDDYNVDDTVLLIGEDGANLRMRNLPLVYKATGKFWVNNHAHILKPKEGRDYDFMAYALEAGDYNDFITGSAQPKLSQANLMAYPITLPPLPEQQAIANYLDDKCAAIDALVAEKEKLIADLETYKKSLIFELVTGKREVA